MPIKGKSTIGTDRGADPLSRKSDLAAPMKEIFTVEMERVVDLPILFVQLEKYKCHLAQRQVAASQPRFGGGRLAGSHSFSSYPPPFSLSG